MVEFRKLVFERCEADPRITRNENHTHVTRAYRCHVGLHAFTPINLDAIRPGCDLVMPPARVPASLHVAALESAPSPDAGANAVRAHNPASADDLLAHNRSRGAESRHGSLPKEPNA